MDHGAQFFSMVQIGETSWLTRVINVENVCSVLGLHKVEDFEERRGNGGSGGNGSLDDTRNCADGSSLRNVLWTERSE